MPWLTQLVNQRVADPQGRRLGRVQDLLAEQGRFPRVTRLELALNRAGRDLLGPPTSVVIVELEDILPSERTFVLKPGAALEGLARNSDVGLKAGLLDRQIVDIEGARVVRVNDVWLAESAMGLRVVGVDVGLGGILRQLRFEGVIRSLTKALGYEITEKLIPWSYVAPLESTPGQLQLTVASHQLRDLHPGELADILEHLDPERREWILAVMTDDRLAGILAETDPGVSRAAVEALGEDRMRRILEIMPPDEAADILGAIGYDRSERLLSLLGLGQASLLRELLGFPPETAGGRMTPSFVAVPPVASAGEVIELIRKEARRAETIYYAYVVDESGRLSGVLSFRDILRSDPSKPAGEVMVANAVSVHVMDDQEDVAHKMARYHLLALPVVDDAGVLKGIVTVDDVVEVLEEEASEDLAEVAGVYVGEGRGARAGRLAGFLASILGGMTAAVLLDSQRAMLISVAAVAWLLPLYLRIAQDLGTWSLARALAGVNMDPGSRLDSLAQELIAALASAAAAAVLVGGFAAGWSRDFAVGGLLGVGIFVGALAASVLGLALPTVARSIPAARLLTRGRFLAMIVGVGTVVIYLWSLGSLASRIG